MYNPYQQFPQPQAMPQSISPQSKNIVRVNGENGARMYPMMPNSSDLLLDESMPIVWLVQTDGAGYKTVTPYDVTPHQQAPAVDFSSLENRIAKLEERMNDESNTKRNRNNQSNKNQASVSNS